MRVGVLALQGDFEAHGRVLRDLGAEVREVRVPADLEGLDGLVIPGGESTTMTLGDIECRRNAFGRQIRSFEADLRIPGVPGKPVRAVFIRAPWVEVCGDDVEVLAAVDGHPVAVRQGNLLVISFHPEIAGETRLHELFLEQVRARLAAPR
jgi:5'-phosphate synthase pdxT subunit